MFLHSPGILPYFKPPMSESELTGETTQGDALKASSLGFFLSSDSLQGYSFSSYQT